MLAQFRQRLWFQASACQCVCHCTYWDHIYYYFRCRIHVCIHSFRCRSLGGDAINSAAAIALRATLLTLIMPTLPLRVDSIWWAFLERRSKAAPTVPEWFWKLFNRVCVRADAFSDERQRHGLVLLELCSKIGPQINFALINVMLWQHPLKWIIRATHQFMSVARFTASFSPFVCACVDRVIKLCACCMQIAALH